MNQKYKFLTVLLLWASLGEAAAPNDRIVNSYISNRDYQIQNGQLSAVPGSRVKTNKEEQYLIEGNQNLIGYYLDQEMSEPAHRLVQIKNDPNQNLLQATTTTFSNNDLRSMTQCYSAQNLGSPPSCATATKRYCQEVQSVLEQQVGEEKQALGIKSGQMQSKLNELGRMCTNYASLLDKAMNARKLPSRTDVVTSDIQALKSAVRKLPGASVWAEFTKSINVPKNSSEAVSKWLNISAFNNDDSGAGGSTTEMPKSSKLKQLRFDFLAFTALIQNCQTQKFADFDQKNMKASPSHQESTR